jgi:hypothetical protein
MFGPKKSEIDFEGLCRRLVRNSVIKRDALVAARRDKISTEQEFNWCDGHIEWQAPSWSQPHIASGDTVRKPSILGRLAERLAG